MKFSLNFADILLLLLVIGSLSSLDAARGKQSSRPTKSIGGSSSGKENSRPKPYEVRPMGGGTKAKFYETPPQGFIHVHKKVKVSASEMIRRPQVPDLIQAQSTAVRSSTLIGNNPKLRDPARLDDQGTGIERPNNFQIQLNGVKPGQHSTFGHTLVDRTITQKRPKYVQRALDRSIHGGIGTNIRYTNSPGSSPFGSPSSSDRESGGRGF